MIKRLFEGDLSSLKNLAFFSAAVLLIAFLLLGGLALLYAFDDASAESLKEMSLKGDIGSERKLADCYEAGCLSIPSAWLKSCAWRSVIAARPDARPEDTMRLVQRCGKLGPIDVVTVERLETDIKSRLNQRH